MKRLTFLIPILISCTTQLAMAQIVRVAYGDGVHTGSIAKTGQVDQYALLNAKSGDVLRISFGSYFYRHQLTVSANAVTVGKLTGRGILTVKLKATATYLIEVKAANRTSTGQYGFQADRLNDPVAGQRIAFGWNMTGGLGSYGQHAIYEVHAQKGAKCEISFGSYFNRHYVEVLDLDHGEANYVREREWHQQRRHVSGDWDLRGVRVLDERHEHRNVRLHSLVQDAPVRLQSALGELRPWMA